MSRGPVVTWLLCAIGLSGCLSTSPQQWTHSPDEATQAKRDIYECKAEARGAADRGVAFGGAVMPIVGYFEMRSRFTECMESRGYKSAE